MVGFLWQIEARTKQFLVKTVNTSVEFVDPEDIDGNMNMQDYALSKY